MDNDNYVGWIPTTLGSLSFSILGTTDFPTRVVFEGDLRVGGDNFIGFQRRYTSDTFLGPLPTFFKRIIDKHLYKKSGDLYFLCSAKRGNNREYIAGDVYIVEKKYSDYITEDFKNQFSTWIEESCQLDFSELSYKIQEKMNAVKFVSHHKFFIWRNGVTQITPLDVKLPKIDSSTFSAEDITSDQVFFFLRDLLHTHKFHSPKTDTLSALTKVNFDFSKQTTYDPNTSVKDSLDRDWRDHVAAAMLRGIINLRRSCDQLHLANALGIICYFQTFVKHVGCDSIIIDLVSFRESIEAAEKKASIGKPKQMFFDKIVKFINIEFYKLLPIYSILISLSIVKGEKSSDYPILSLVSDIKFVVIIISIAALLSFLNMMLGYKTRLHRRMSIGIKTYSLFIGQNRGSIFLFFAGIVCFCISFWIFYRVLLFTGRL